MNRHTERSRVRESLIIFITPRIIRDADTVQQLIEAEDSKRRSRIEAEVERIFGGDEGVNDN